MNRISHVAIVLTPMIISSFTIATLNIRSPPLVILTAMGMTDFFVSVDARGFSHAMENRRLLTCLVYALYSSGITFLNAVVSKRLESTEVQRMMY